ncbi:MAG: hypothetical protein WKF47_03195 [Geodermatophilaceae bacterium]
MCRHVAYLGTAASLESMVSTPAALVAAGSPGRHAGSAYGTVNADGFGVGWYADGDPIPARYRQWPSRCGRMRSFVDLARVVRTRCDAGGCP